MCYLLINQPRALRATIKPDARILEDSVGQIFSIKLDLTSINPTWQSYRAGPKENFAVDLENTPPCGQNIICYIDQFNYHRSRFSFLWDYHRI